MKVYETDQVVTVDCDDTLVMWSDKYTQPHEGAIPVPDPYDNSTNYLVPHKKHIELVRKYKGRGFLVIVWSAAGVQWAHSVVKTLKLEPFVDIVLSKPTRYVDDYDCTKWMGNRVYIKENK